MTAVLTFSAAALVLIVAAVFLTRAADAIADGTGIGRVWIGALLLAGATSLPELVTDISSVRIGAADLAAGDLFGSSLANMFILALVDIALPRARILQRAAFDHVLVATLAIGLTALAALFVLARIEGGWGWLGAAPLVLLLIYAMGMRAVFHKGQQGRAVAAADPENVVEVPPPPVRKRLLRPILELVIAAGAILAAGPFAAQAAAEIAVLTGLGNTFVGTTLVGLSTSLPELVASVAAVRLGAIDLAVGNLFGSNAFNVVIFVALDAVEPSRGFFSTVSESHALSGMLAVVLMALALAALVYRAERRFALLPFDSLLIVVGYAASLTILRTWG